MTHWHAPKPETLTFVIGDIHGCADRLSSLLVQIDEDCADHPDIEAKIVFVGDYIDRGEESAAVLAFLVGVQSEHGDQVTCLAGNHEQMMLDFLNDPFVKGKRWLRHGGVQTLASYGIAPPKDPQRPSAAELLEISGDLRSALGPELIEWVTNLPLVWNSNNLWVTHAGADPALPMSEQLDETLLWGTAAFLNEERTDGQWVVYGHQPVDAPVAERGRIAVDTGAVYGSSLTALRATPEGDVTFLQG